MNYILLLLLAIALVIILPFASIWSLNTLFPLLDIQYTFETWVAALFLSNSIFGKHVKLMK
jgi:ABC-type uncharacterized transport system YnjBCD permease subunit